MTGATWRPDVASIRPAAGPPGGKAPALSAGAWLACPSGWQREMAVHTATLNLMWKVLDFIQFGGPGWTRTIDLGLIKTSVKNQPKSGRCRYKMPGVLPPFLR